MKRGFFILIVFCTAIASSGQELSAEELISLSSLSSQKFDQAIGKKGFSKAELSDYNSAVVHGYHQKIRSDTQALRYAERHQEGNDQYVVFKTTSEQEFFSLRQQLKMLGFFYGADTLPNTISQILFQKKNVAVLTERIIDNTDTLYSFRFEHKSLQSSAVRYADDLLQFSSHQHLISMFGAANVVKDVYHYSATES